jgi:PIN domain nuclease of toxin-antitoxin system
VTRRAVRGGAAGGRRPALVWRVGSRADYIGPLLLDTHLWVWMLDTASGRLPTPLLPLIRNAARDGRLYVSEISFWEVAQKVGKGRLGLTMPLSAWARRAASAPGVNYLPLDREVLLTSVGLEAMRGDPADRILVASAKLHAMPLATADRVIIDWARQEGKTAVCDCR